MKKLEVDQQMLIEQRVANEAKTPVVAYLLWFFLGSFGGHRFYLGKKTSGIVMAVLTLVGILTTAILIGFLILIGVGVWVLIDAIMIPKVLAEHREELRKELEAEYGATDAPSEDDEIGLA
ncbi:TM2 domain-containing protein [Sulfitobacter sp. R18_1]|uniref:TM2 domain-containing protein n=1 Tax=Sulfitobacter sp. R18_1 TaxID=2821104 RepID=UPI001ADAB7F5|nr:TM2 domain-containing protein [Sulfitobacter sp. R18_1]MBO9428744.1 TM2 domain-containing protein [Sulfitobacter sp. R18_1]